MFDLHVHTAPDVQERYGDDFAIARLYERAGFTGCVIKAHYDATGGRARAAGHGLALNVYGALALNQHVGGLNPAAVAAALAIGARVVWMPTTDSHTQEAAGLPRLCRAIPQLAPTTYAIPPVDYSTEASVRQIVALIAEADAVLATGHLSAAETAWLLPVARAAGVRRLLITHPTYVVPGMTAAEVSELTAQGAYAEITAYQLLHQPDCTPGQLANLIRAVGHEHIILSSDAGQPDSPPPPEALGLLLEALINQDLDPHALTACASELPEKLVTPG